MMTGSPEIACAGNGQERVQQGNCKDSAASRFASSRRCCLGGSGVSFPPVVHRVRTIGYEPIAIRRNLPPAGGGRRSKPEALIHDEPDGGSSSWQRTRCSVIGTSPVQSSVRRWRNMR